MALKDVSEKFAQKMYRLLFESNISFRVYQCSREYKDIFEYYVDGENLKFLLDGLVDGALTLAKADGINQIKQLTDLCRSDCYEKRKFEVAELFTESVKLDRWAAEFLKALKKERTSAPFKHDISDEVFRKHK